MKKQVFKSVVKYKPLSAENDSAFKTEHSLDTMTFSGSYLVEINHNGTDVGLPIEDCGKEHYIVGTLVVTDSGTAGRKQNNRVIGQVLTLTSRESKETKVYSRTFADGYWSPWRSLALAGTYNNISTTDELVATVEELVAENKSIKTALSSEITRSEITDDSMKKNAVQSGSLHITPDADSVKIVCSNIDGSLVSEVSLPLATTEKAGVMGAEDKRILYNGAQCNDVPMLLRKNYYNPDDEDFVGGYFLDLDGNLNESSGYCVTGYIPLNSVVGQLICSRNGSIDSDNGGAIGFYDENKQPLFYKPYKSVNGIAVWEYKVAYVRFSIRFFSIGHIQIEQGDKYTSKIGYGESVWNVELPYGYVEPQSLSLIFGVKKSLNLLNPSEIQKGMAAYISNGEIKFTALSSITASGFIEVNPMTTYTFRYSQQYFFLDADKNVIGDKISAIGTAIATTPENCRYLVINFYNTRSSLGLYNLDATARVYEGEVLYPYIPYGISSDKMQTYLQQQSVSSLGNNGVRVPRASVAANTNITTNTQGYPHSIKNNQIVFYGKFDTFDTLTIGRGFTNNAYSGCRFEITPTNITLSKYDGGWVQQATVEHGLSMNTYVKVLVSERKNKVLLCVRTLTGSFEHEFDYWSANGLIAVRCSMATTDTLLSLSNPSFKCPVWMFGDSYYGAETTNRQLYWLRKWGYDNTLVQSFGGQGSNDAYQDLLRCLDFGTPKYLVWSLGMNDDNSGVLSDITTGVWYTTYQKVKKICEAMDIELILTTIPEVRGGYPNKDAISEVVRNSGLRYIDAARAIGSNAIGEWYGNGTEYDYQSSDNVHPSEYGAKAIAMQVLIDFPEIMQY